MGTTQHTNLPYPEQSDPVDVAQDIKELAEAIDNRFWINGQFTTWKVGSTKQFPKDTVIAVNYDVQVEPLPPGWQKRSSGNYGIVVPEDGMYLVHASMNSKIDKNATTPADVGHRMVQVLVNDQTLERTLVPGINNWGATTIGATCFRHVQAGGVIHVEARQTSPVDGEFNEDCWFSIVRMI